MSTLTSEIVEGHWDSQTLHRISLSRIDNRRQSYFMYTNIQYIKKKVIFFSIWLYLE